jgi:hypothetical protein
MDRNKLDSLNPWIFFHVDPTRAQTVALAIKAKWEQVADAPSSAAVLAQLNLRDGSMNFHLSPEAAYALPSLIDEYGGIECKEPARMRGTWVLAGNSNAIDRLRREFATLVDHSSASGGP